MKALTIKTFLLFIIVLISIGLFSQVPVHLPYQAIARDKKGDVIAGKRVSLRFTIVDKMENGKVLYQEIQAVNTTATGLFNVNVGEGVKVSGRLETIDWTTGNKFETVEIDPEGGVAFVELSRQQMMNVSTTSVKRDPGNLSFHVSKTGDTLYLGDSFMIVEGISEKNTNNKPIDLRLASGETPFQIFKSGISMDSIYGRMYQGGLIFYLDTTDGDGLVCANDNLGFAEWGSYGISVCGSHHDDIGSGFDNTAEIISNSTPSGNAAQLCHKLILNGYKDWFLPSKDELNLMNLNLKQRGLGNFGPVYYWSSTEKDAESSWAQFFFGGAQVCFGKNFSFAVRPVREFR